MGENVPRPLPECLPSLLTLMRGPGTALPANGTDRFAYFDRFAGGVARTLRACGAAVTIRDGTDRWLLGVSGCHEPLRSGRRLPYAESLCRRVIDARKPVVIATPDADAQMTRLVALGFQARAYAGVPLWIGGDSVVGTLCVTSICPRRWTDAEIATLAEWAAAAASCIELLLDVAPLPDGSENVHELGPELLQAQKLEVIGRVASGIVHDVNNLLCVIGNSASLALQDLSENAADREDLEVISRAVETASALMRQLLAFASQRPIEPVPIDVEDEVRSTISMLRRLCDRSIEIGEDLRSVGRVRAGPGQIAQVVMNLALNARDAMPRGGKLGFELRGVHLSRAEASHLKVGLQAGAYVRLVVCDTGDGIDQAYLPRVLDSFFTTKEIGTGTGLGLATVCSVLRQLDGHMVVENRVGKGAQFTVYLPRANQG